MLLLLNTILIHYRTSDTMYKSSHIVETRKYEEWNQYIYRTCTSCNRIGKVTVCHNYSCNYVKTYPEYNVMIDNHNKEYEISDSEHSRLVNKFGTPTTFVDMHRPFYTKDGDMYKNNWNGELEKSFVISYKESYENKTQAFHALFHLEDIEDEEKEKWKLYDYPDIENHRQAVVLGKVIDENTDTKLQAINGLIGEKLNLKLFILYFYDQSQKAAFKQRSYWEGGNKNELIICLGVDSLTNKTTWAQAFSWSDDNKLNEKCEDLFKDGVVADLNTLSDEIYKNVALYWKPKDFKDFDYLEVEITTAQLELIVFLLLLYNIGISVWVVRNEYKHGINLNKQN